jgi:ribosomal protein S18 acetylase RimI-like enzyme
MHYLIEEVESNTAEALCREITANLPEYFGLLQANEYYALGVRAHLNLAIKVENRYIGLISVNFPYPQNANIYWLGVLSNYHGKGLGKALAQRAMKVVQAKGSKTITVETLSPKENDDNYLKTYNFYKSLGFKPLFNLKPQGYEFEMVYMLKDLKIYE